MFFNYLLACGVACGFIAWRTRHSDVRFLATFAAMAMSVIALLNWNLW